MPRSGADARRRLQGAALELWSERGYDRTTAAEIAARAGVTERTFFRHFPDKREVLFDGAVEMRDTLAAALTAAPASLGPLDALRRALGALGPLFEPNRPYSAARRAVIADTPALQERELAKGALLMAVLAAGLRGRGVEERAAMMAAQAGMAAFGHAATAWSEAPARSLDACLDEAFAQLRRLCSPVACADGDPGEPPAARPSGTRPADGA